MGLEAPAGAHALAGGDVGRGPRDEVRRLPGACLDAHAPDLGSEGAAESLLLGLAGQPLGEGADVLLGQASADGLADTGAQIHQELGGGVLVALQDELRADGRRGGTDRHQDRAALAQGDDGRGDQHGHVHELVERAFRRLLVDIEVPLEPCRNALEFRDLVARDLEVRRMFVEEGLVESDLGIVGVLVGPFHQAVLDVAEPVPSFRELAAVLDHGALEGEGARGQPGALLGEPPRLVRSLRIRTGRPGAGSSAPGGVDAPSSRRSCP